jgi:hypothetical protein
MNQPIAPLEDALTHIGRETRNAVTSFTLVIPSAQLFLITEAF